MYHERNYKWKSVMPLSLPLIWHFVAVFSRIVHMIHSGTNVKLLVTWEIWNISCWYFGHPVLLDLKKKSIWYFSIPRLLIQGIKIAKRLFENVSQFKYLGMTVTNQNLIQEKIKRRLNSGNACYHSVQNVLSSRLLSKNLKIRIYKTRILLLVLCGCETCLWH
jgi:hypothetical protein